jgi:hypothetical protein
VKDLNLQWVLASGFETISNLHFVSKLFRNFKIPSSISKFDEEDSTSFSLGTIGAGFLVSLAGLE